MRYCKNKFNIFASLVLLPALLVMYSGNVQADGIIVRKAEIRLTEEGYQLTANFDIRLSPLLEQALTHGIPLNFVSEFTVTKSRWYWFDEITSKSEESTKLSYNSLTRQYRIKRETLFQNFSTLDEALRALGNQSSNIISNEIVSKSSGYIASFFTKKSNYTAFARMKLEISQLPKPLQVSALTNDEWKLDSEGYSWVLTAEELVQARKTTP